MPRSSYSVAGRRTTTDFARVASSRSSEITCPPGAVAAYTPSIPAGSSARPWRADSASVGAQLATRKRQQARLVEGVRQLGVLGQGRQSAGLVEPESADAGAPQRGEMPADAEGGADVAGQRPDVGTARTVHLDVDVDQVGGPSDVAHLEPVDTHGTGGQLDGLALAGELVGALACRP